MTYTPVPNKVREFRKANRLPGLKVIESDTGINKDVLSMVERGRANLRDDQKLALCRYFSKKLDREVEVTELFFQEAS